MEPRALRATRLPHPTPGNESAAAARPATALETSVDQPSAAAIYRPTIRELPAGERPRERLKAYGENALSTAELLAIILRVGVAGENVLDVAERLLSQHGGLIGLARLRFEDLCASRGLGEAKAAQLRAALELGRRLAAEGPEQRPIIRGPEDVVRLLQAQMQLLEQEQLRILALTTKNHVLAMPVISTGTVNQSQVRPAEVFKPAVRMNATSIIIVHNHPSGDPSPSKEDVAITRELVAAGRLLEIEVLDHVIIGVGRYVSLKDQGLGF